MALYVSPSLLLLMNNKAKEDLGQPLKVVGPVSLGDLHGNCTGGASSVSRLRRMTPSLLLDEDDKRWERLDAVSGWRRSRTIVFTEKVFFPFQCEMFDHERTASTAGSSCIPTEHLTKVINEKEMTRVAQQPEEPCRLACRLHIDAVASISSGVSATFPQRNLVNVYIYTFLVK